MSVFREEEGLSKPLTLVKEGINSKPYSENSGAEIPALLLPIATLVGGARTLPVL